MTQIFFNAFTAFTSSVCNLGRFLSWCLYCSRLSKTIQKFRIFEYLYYITKWILQNILRRGSALFYFGENWEWNVACAKKIHITDGEVNYIFEPFNSSFTFMGCPGYSPFYKFAKCTNAIYTSYYIQRKLFNTIKKKMFAVNLSS